MGVSKEQRMNNESHHDAMVKMDISERAKEIFKRKPYEIKRGDAGGQKDTERLHRCV